jgi:predicted DNA-binding protein with PD1-like motif
MKYASLDDHTFALKLEPGDKINETIAQFCAEHDIANASVQGIGSVDSPELAHYTMPTKHFESKRLDGIYEITSLLGNVAVSDGGPLVHLHVTISDEQMVTYGGHLMAGTCSATLELTITAYPTKHTKTLNDDIGLKVWDF